MKDRSPTLPKPLDDVDLRLLHVFRTVVECGGYTPAESALQAALDGG